MTCPHCNHSEEDHVGHWADGTLIPGKHCFYAENQGYSQDLCDCPGFDVSPNTPPTSYLESLMSKAGV